MNPPSLSALRWFIPLLALAPHAATQDRVEFTDDLYPGCTQRGDERWIVSRVVDDITGAPVAGAEVLLIREHPTPLAGERWHTRKATTDAQGYLRVRVDDIDGQWHIQAISGVGIGAGSRSGTGDAIWRVGRPFDVPVLVLDHAGKPAPGARIGFCGGCGHTPDLVNATADEHGIAVLRGIDPLNDIADVYVQQPGLGLGYQRVEWYPGDPPAVIQCSWSPAMNGRLLDATGKPIGGAFVGAPDVHRGPWTKTNADGTFTLLGADPGIGPSQVMMADGTEFYFRAASRYPVTLRLPAADAEDPREGTLDVPERERRRVETRPLTLQLDENDDRILVVDCWFDGAGRGLIGRTDAVEVPRSGPFVLGVRPKNGAGRPASKRHAFADQKDLPQGPLRLGYFATTHVVGKVTDPSGRAIAARVRWRQSWTTTSDDETVRLHDAAGGAIDLHTWRTGLSLLEVTAADGSLPPRLLWVTLPLHADTPQQVDLGTIALRDRPQLVVRAPGDEPPLVTFVRAGLQEAGDERELRVADDGSCLCPDLRAGDAVIVRLDEDAVPARTVLEGAGPWTITAPTGALDFEVLGADGEPVAATVSFADQAVEGDGTIALRGLPTGTQRFFVAAPECRTAIVDADVTTTARLVRVLLPGRK